MPASFSAPIMSSISCRSIRPPQAIVASAVGDRLVTEPERFGCDDIERCRWLTLAGQDIEHEVAADRPASQRLGAGGLDRIDPVGHDRSQDPDHLPVAIALVAEA